MFATQSRRTIYLQTVVKIKGGYLLPVERLIDQLPLKPGDQRNGSTSIGGDRRNTKPAQVCEASPKHHSFQSTSKSEKLPSARIQVQGLLRAADEALHLLAGGKTQHSRSQHKHLATTTTTLDTRTCVPTPTQPC